MALVEIKMATRKRAATSESGAYMSQYDQEVESRLSIIEARLAEIEVAIHQLKEAPAAAEPTAPAGADPRVDKIISALKVAVPGAAKNL